MVLPFLMGLHFDFTHPQKSTLEKKTCKKPTKFSQLHWFQPNPAPLFWGRMSFLSYSKTDPVAPLASCFNFKPPASSSHRANQGGNAKKTHTWWLGKNIFFQMVVSWWFTMVECKKSQHFNHTNGMSHAWGTFRCLSCFWQVWYAPAAKSWICIETSLGKNTWFPKRWFHNDLPYGTISKSNTWKTHQNVRIWANYHFSPAFQVANRRWMVAIICPNRFGWCSLKPFFP